MTKKLFTFGYEGISIEQFIHRLKVAKIDCVVDVRALPLSRKKGFSKTAFSQILHENGIDYRHEVAVGCPKKIRDKYKSDGSWLKYTKAYLEYLASQHHCVTEIAQLGRTQTCCLVCFEADFNMCHRTYVARAISSSSKLAVVHLTDQKEILDTVRPLAA